MLFNSFEFLCFLPFVVCIYFLTPFRFRWLLLLAASYFFYGSWKVEYLLLIVLSTLIDYLAALKIASTAIRNQKKVWLWLSLLTNLSVLFWFKYYGFFSSSLNPILNQASIAQLPVLDLILPVGISFYTFQSMSYTIDVYRDNREPERHLGIFALYVSFFPQLVAGPIERSSRLLPQFFIKHEFEPSRVISGTKQIIRGFFKKVVVADRLGIYVDTIYNNYENHTGSSLVLATVFFAVQIYCDFSGYSDIAIGSARIMGYELMENFKRPYFAMGIRKFWSRWHISLSTWFRDYLYIPLGGNRVGESRFYFNLMLVFLVSGVWHGANWTFIFWGFLHGVYICIESAYSRSSWSARVIYSKQLHGVLAQLLTFALVCFAWIFFRAPSIEVAFEIIAKMLHFKGGIYFGGEGNLMYSFLAIGCLIFAEIRQELLVERKSRFGAYGDFFKYAFIVLFIILFGVFDEGQFIYFQF